MAAVAVHSVMTIEEKNHLHPFFGRSSGKRSESEPMELNENLQPTESEQSDRVGHGTKPKRSKRAQDSRQRTILQGFKIDPQAPFADDHARPARPAINLHLEDGELNQRPRKKRKTVSPHAHGAEDNKDFEQELAKRTSELTWLGHFEREVNHAAKESSPTPEVHHQKVQSSVSIDDNRQTSEAKSIRTIQLKNGRLTSPKRDSKIRINGSEVSSKRSIAKLRYPAALVDRIRDILNGKAKPDPESKVPPRSEALKAKKHTGPAKAPHPFFMGRTAQNDGVLEAQSGETRQAETKASSILKTATTPGKIRAERDAFQASKGCLDREVVPNAPAIHRVPKAAGMRQPAWPTHENVHVRALEKCTLHAPGEISSCGFVVKSLKRPKSNASVEQAESVLENSSVRMKPSKISLRIPKRVITTGLQMQEEVFPKLSSSQISSAHPMLLSMFSAIGNELTPFDKYESETQAWTQKYSPKSANEVLQHGTEAQVLRDWLQKLTISAVQTSSGISTTISTTFRLKSKAKRNRTDGLDDFLIDSENEDYDSDDEMKELEDDDNRKRPKSKRSVVRGGRKKSSLPPGSAVLLSGPSGCGKTATVYAAAKELGFEVFELNSATRRSGKDVMDKIGDMTENHLVQQVSKALANDKSPQEAKPQAVCIEDSTAPDTKQRSMAAFFKPAAAKKPVSTKPLSKPIFKAKETPHQLRPKQKQSLILFEEVDILFEEDKQFWLTILALAAHSKRPIVMTCNDESFIPLDSLALQAILRIAPPPVHLATDYLLLLAAREGHALERMAIESLYKSTKCDLRASITELNFWCQMAVGDPTRGFHWLLERFPPGSDVDEHGRTLRVTSHDTYTRGLGMVSSDHQASPESASSMWGQAWDDWEINPTQAAVKAMELAENTTNVEKLCLWEFASDIASVADSCCGFSMRNSQNQHIDPSIPTLTDKTKGNYMVGLSHSPMVLQTDTMPDYLRVDEQLAIATQLEVSRLLTQHTEQQTYAEPDAQQIISIVETKGANYDTKESLSRDDFQQVLVPLAEDPEPKESVGSTFPASSVDREFSIIPADLAPYIRLIVAQQMKRNEEHLRMSNLVSAGGERRARPRTTRTAMNAVDGGRRRDQYTARYFERLAKLGLDCEGIINTGGKNWRTLDDDDKTRRSETKAISAGRRSSVRTIVESDYEE